MKKQILAAAVATAMAAPMVASAGDVTLYGVVHMSINSLDFDTGRGATAFSGTNMDVEGTSAVAASQGTPVVDGGGVATGDFVNPVAAVAAEGFDGISVDSHYTRFGIKGTEDLGNGLSAFFQMEFLTAGDDSNTTAGSAVINNRNTFVGLASSIGKIGIGRNDSPYKKSTGKLELFSSIPGDYNGLGFDDVRMQDTIFYYSPNWNGFSFGAAVGVPSSDRGGVDSDGVEILSLAATYKNGPFFFSLAREEESQEFLNSAEDYEKWRLGLGYTANNFHVGFIYEDADDANGVNGADEEIWQISASYTFGNNVIKAAYGEAELDVNNTDPEMWSIALDHKLSKRTKLYVVAAEHDSDAGNAEGDEISGISLGIVHKF